MTHEQIAAEEHEILGQNTPTDTGGRSCTSGRPTWELERGMLRPRQTWPRFRTRGRCQRSCVVRRGLAAWQKLAVRLLGQIEWSAATTTLAVLAVESDVVEVRQGATEHSKGANHATMGNR